MVSVLRAARRGRNRVGVIAFIAVGLVASVLEGGSTHAAGGPTWWKVDTHEHSSYSGDGRQDVALLASRDKSLNYNGIFVTDHDRGSTFNVSGANGNYLDYRDALSARWHQKTINNPTTFSYSTVTSQLHSGTASLHVSVTSPNATNMGSVVYANRGPTIRSGDVTLDFWLRPAQISAGSGVDVAVSLGGDLTTGQTPYGYTTSDGVPHGGKSTVLVWQIGSARTASNNGTTHVIVNTLPGYTLNTWNHYVINVMTGATSWTPSGGSTTNVSSSGLSSLTAADAPASDVVLANVTMHASATNGTADAYVDDYTLKSANQNCPAADFAARNVAIDSGSYNGTNALGQSFMLFPAREMGQTYHANQFNFDFATAAQYYDVFSDSLANDGTLCAGTNNPGAPWQFQNHGVDNIPSVQASGYPAQYNHPGVTESASDATTTLARGADAIEAENSADYTAIWDSILQQHRQIMGTWGTDAHEKVGTGGEADYIDAPALTLNDLLHSYFEGRMFGAPNNFGGHLAFNLDPSSSSPYPARYPVYVPATQAAASVHLKIDGGLSAGQTVKWLYNSGSGNTTITDTVSGSTYEQAKAIPLTGAFTYVRAEVRDAAGALLATTQPIFFEDVTGLQSGVSYHVDSVTAASGCACTRTITQGVTSTSWSSGTNVLSITLTDQSGSTVKLLGKAGAAPTLVRMDGSTITQSASLAAFQSATGNAWFYDSPTQTLYLQDLQNSGTSTILVTLPAGGANQAPTAGPVSLSAPAGVSTPWTPVVSDPNNDPLTCTIVNPPSHGSATLPSCSGGTYTATGGYSGPDSFTYKANDGLLDSPTATVTVNVSSGGGGAIGLVQQKPASGSTATLAATLNAPSASGNALVASVAIAAGSSASVLSVTDSGSGAWTKGPVGFLSGTNSRVEIWYRLGASSVTSVTVTLSAAKSAALNVSEWAGVASVDGSLGGSGASSTTASTPSLATSNATDLVIGAINYPAGVSSTLASGSFTGLTDFSFSSSVHGRAAYRVTSATGSFQASWTLAGASGGNGGAVLALKASGGGGGNQPPVANPVSLNATTGVPASWTPSVSDPNGDTLTCSIVTPPVNGTASVNSNCSSGSYTSNGGFTGQETFTYKATDTSNANSSPATVTVTVGSGNQPPVANPVSLNATTGVPASWTPSVSDPNGDTLTCSIVTPPVNGTASVNSNCSSGSYTSNGGFTGQETFTYRATDTSNANSSPATVTATVSSGGGGGGIAFVQQAVASGTAASLPVTLPATGAGHALVAVVALAAGSSASVSSVTDSASGTWTPGPVGFLTGVNSRVEIWYRLGAPSVTSVTVTLSAAKSAAVNVTEWSGVATASAVDGSLGGSGASSTTASTPSLATLNATDLVIGAVNYPAAATSTLASGSFTGLSDLNASTSVHGRAAYQITSATGSFQASWTLSAVSGGNGGAILALKAA